MFAKFVVVFVAVLALVSAANVQESKKVAKAEIARMKERRVRQMPVHGKKAGAKTASTTNTFVSFMFYSDSTCDTLTETLTYGTNFCMAVTDATNSASSTQITWDSTTSVLAQTWYSDSACATEVSAGEILDLSSMTAGTCSSVDTMYTTATTYSTPTDTGAFIGYFSSSSTCSAETPYEALWTPITGDDDITFDDDLDIDLICYDDSALPFVSEGDDGTSATATFYLTSGFTPLSGGGSDDDSDSCFAGSETVQMADGSFKAISEVAVGDSILSADAQGNTKFSEVIAVPHAQNGKAATFTQLTVASGADIKMTPEHLVMVSESCDGSSKLMAAKSVNSGMCLMSTSGLETVASTESVTSTGIYTVVTNEEFVVVNGFVASPFAVNHAAANAYYNVVRAVPSIMNLEVVKQASLIFGNLANEISM